MYRVEANVSKSELVETWKSSALMGWKDAALEMAETIWTKWNIHTRVIDDDTGDMLCEFEV